MTARRTWLAAMLLLALGAQASFAAPARIIILRHGEKENAFRLCRVGLDRAQALAGRYLGRGAQAPLLSDAGPAAVFATTLHTLELGAPAAMSWGLPLTVFPSLPDETDGFTATISAQTQAAVHSLMGDSRFDGRAVVMVWEHHHIANAELEAANPGQQVTLRQLLKLDALPGVPTTWPPETYDYFWIVDFAPDGTPTRFTMQKQVFDGPFAQVPSNDWGAPDGLTEESGCLG